MLGVDMSFPAGEVNFTFRRYVLVLLYVRIFEFLGHACNPIVPQRNGGALTLFERRDAIACQGYGTPHSSTVRT